MAEDIVWYEVELDANDGTANRETLQTALVSNKYVKIKTGEYPIDPEIIINSATLDLGGSVLTDSTDRENSGTVFQLIGDSPTIQNGSIKGACYTTFTGTSDPLYYEGRRLVSPMSGAYSNALVKNLDLSHTWGYAISGSGQSYVDSPISGIGFDGNYQPYATKYSVQIVGKIGSVGTTLASSTENIGGSVSQTDSGYEYLSATIPLNLVYAAQEKVDGLMTYHGKPKYVAIGTGRATKHFGDGDISFIFEISDGSVQTVNALQGALVEIPENATSLAVKIYMSWEFLSGDSYRNPARYVMYFTYYNGGLTVTDCNLHENGNLGMTGSSLGSTYVYNCTSTLNGRAGGSGTSTGQTTSGFIDCEEDPPCYILIQNCTSTEETNSAMLNVITGDVKDCNFVSCLSYGGKWINFDNVQCSGYIGLNTSGVSNRVTKVTVTNSSGICGTGLNFDVSDGNLSQTYMPENVYTKNCTFYNSQPIRPKSVSENCEYYWNGSNVARAEISGIVEAKVHPLVSNGWGYMFSHGHFAPAEGSSVEIYANEWASLYNKTYAGKDNWLEITGDAWVDFSDTAILPNGYTLTGCTFTTGSVSLAGKDDSSKFAGTYQDCVFNLDNNPFYKNFSGTYPSDQLIYFTGCTINNKNNYLYDGNVSSAFTFLDCVIADENKICRSGSSSYKFLYSVTPSLKGCSGIFPEAIERGSTATIFLAAEGDYTLPTEVTVTGATSSYNAETGVLTVSSPTGPVTVTATVDGYREPELTVYSRTGSKLAKVYSRNGTELSHIYSRSCTESTNV